jgi:NAD(P)-dependent dehydrogenase (short-subunit alcohol dehydrogenase family)
MKSKRYLIIGGSSGIGLSLCKMLSDQGHQVIATTTREKEVTGSENIHYSYLNVLDDNPSMDFIEGSIDGLVYCPGAINLQPFSKIRPRTLMQDYQLQLVGAVQCIQGALPHLKSSDSPPSIVLFSTVAVQKGYPFHGIVASSKGAVEGMTRSLAAELAPNIRVNCIAPSLTNTRMASRLLNSETKRNNMSNRNPMKKIGQPDDIAHMAAFLLSDNSSWITGQILSIDGGASVLHMS